MKNLFFFLIGLFFVSAQAFGPSAEERAKMKTFKELCEPHLKNFCGSELEFPDIDNFSPSPGMFQKIKHIKKCIKSDAVQNANIPSYCKKDIGPGN